MLTLLFGFSLAHAGNSVEFTCSEENVWKGLGEKPERLRHARRVYSKTIDPDQLYRDFNSGWKNSSPILISENSLEIYLVPSMDEGANRYLDLTFMIENYFIFDETVPSDCWIRDARGGFIFGAHSDLSHQGFGDFMLQKLLSFKIGPPKIQSRNLKLNKGTKKVAESTYSIQVIGLGLNSSFQRETRNAVLELKIRDVCADFQSYCPRLSIERTNWSKMKDSEPRPKAGKEPYDLGEALATVNGKPIYSRAFKRLASRKVPKDGLVLNKSERKELLDKLIKDELLYQEAMNRNLFLDTKVKKVMTNALLREEIYAEVNGNEFSEAEILRFYNSHKEEFSIPEKVQFQKMLFRVKDDMDESAALAKAERIHELLLKDVSTFSELSVKHSDDPYRRRGGDVGFVSRKGKPGIEDAIIQKAFSMKKGQLSKPVKTGQGYTIIFIKEKREPFQRSLKTTKSAVLRKMKNLKLDELFDAYTAKLGKAAEIIVFEEMLDGVELKSHPAPGVSPEDDGLNK